MLTLHVCVVKFKRTKTVENSYLNPLHYKHATH